MQLLAPCQLLAKAHGRDAICSMDVEESRNMFLDAKTSAKVCNDDADVKME